MDYENKSLFMKGLFVKLIGGIGFFSVYTFYYSYGGDSKSYFKSALLVNELLEESVVEWVKVLFAESDYLRSNHYTLLQKIPWGPESSEWMMVRFVAVICLFGFMNYFATTLVFAFLSFVGVWQFYKVFEKRYPKLKYKTAIAILFVPSVFFWGSGIMKDSLVIGFLGVILYHVQLLIDRKARSKILSILILFIAGFIVFKVKAYVIISLVPALVIWLVMHVKGGISNNFVRKAIAPFFLAITFVGVGYSVTLLGTFTEKYSIDGVLKTAKGMQTWHYVEGDNFGTSHGRGSSYSLGDYDPTLIGTLGQFFPAINVTLFRPYLTEVRSPVMLAAAIESLIVLLYTIYIVLGLGVVKLYKAISRDPFLLMCITFALFFAFAVGFTSYNFGALVRYKIPCIPFYICSLVILQEKVREFKRAKTPMGRRERSRSRKTQIGYSP